jgi:hypothetical protein
MSNAEHQYRFHGDARLSTVFHGVSRAYKVLAEFLFDILLAEVRMRLANETKNRKAKVKLLEMAQEWFKLAIEAEAEVEGGNGKGKGKGLIS